MPSLAYTYRNVQAFQGVRDKLSTLIPPIVFRKHSVALPGIRNATVDEDLSPVLRKSNSLSTNTAEDIELGIHHQDGGGTFAGYEPDINK
jgi:hypothetical protein